MQEKKNVNVLFFWNMILYFIMQQSGILKIYLLPWKNYSFL